MKEDVRLEMLLTGAELCERLKVKQSFLYNPAQRKGPTAIPCIRVGKYLRYNEHAVREFLLRQNQIQG